MRNKKRGALASLIFSLCVLFSFRGSSFESILRYLTRGTVSWKKLEFLWRANPTQLIMFLIYLFCVIVAVVSFIRLLIPAGTRSSAERPVRTERPVTNAAKRTAPRSGARRTAGEQEEAIHCQHKSGSEKYLEQIDGYLRTGLIDRSEYKVLRERYQKLNIPDDYH